MGIKGMFVGILLGYLMILTLTLMVMFISWEKPSKEVRWVMFRLGTVFAIIFGFIGYFVNIPR